MMIGPGRLGLRFWTNRVVTPNTGDDPDHARGNLDMAGIIIPPPDAAGYWHFTYITRDPATGQWYGGKRSTKRAPLSDRYLGSGKWIKRHSARERLQREIVAFYATSKEVYAAEARMITWATVMDDPLCMNLWAGGQGITSEGALHRSADPEWRQNNLAGIRLRSANLEWRANQTVGAAKRLADPAWHESNKTAAHIRSADPKWIENHGAAMALVYADPQWRENLLEGIAVRSADPAWPAAHAAAIAKRSSNPEWKKNQAASTRRTIATCEWKEAQLAGARKLAVVFVDLNGKQMSIADACRETGMSYKLALDRRRHGWPESDWLLPPRAKKMVAGSRPSTRAPIFVSLNGKRIRLKEACRQAGIPYPTAHDRRRKGWPESEWLTPFTRKRAAR